jgi:hypothetical protein
MSEEFNQYEEEEEVEYEYESDDEVDSVVACVVNGKAQSHKKADTKKGGENFVCCVLCTITHPCRCFQNL